MKPWTATDKLWATLSGNQRAVVMALMEADKNDAADAKNVLAAIVNRVEKTKEQLGKHVSRPIYQPTIEPMQQKKLPILLKHAAFPELLQWLEKRLKGEEPDIVNGATHFLAHESVMLKLTAKNPRKYKSWPKWTGYNPKTKQYANVVLRDKSHAFIKSPK